MKLKAEGYIIAKRDIKVVLDNRITKYELKVAQAQLDKDEQKYVINKIMVEELEAIKSYVRNSMLWDDDND